MTSPESVALYGGVALGILTLAGTGVSWILAQQDKAHDREVERIDKDAEELSRALEAGLASIRERNGILFAKLDQQARELHEYKLHVAETYVNQAALEKIFEPINRRLENIENDLRGHGARA